MDEQDKEIVFYLVLAICSITVVLVNKLLQNDRPPTTPPRNYISQTSSQWRISQNLSRSDIGVNFNKWKQPTCEFGPDEGWMENELMNAFGQFNIPDSQWKRATGVVDNVLEMLFFEIQKETQKYERLVVEKYIRQGSSREGLKVGEADEFDNLLKFHIDGLHFKFDPVKPRFGEPVPELIHLTVTEDTGMLQSRFPRLYNKGVFYRSDDGNIYLNARRLHERVFTSIIDAAKSTVSKRVSRPEDLQKFGFRIRRSLNPPSINIVIEMVQLDDDFDGFGRIATARASYPRVVLEAASRPITTKIDVDIVPGLLLQNDKVPDPCARGQTMDCPRYAVTKWVTDNHSSASRYPITPEIIWRNCSSGYEKHLLDVARGSTAQRYIITAVRVAKAYFRWRKSRSSPPPQIVTVLRSYHLKHVGFYCILYLTVINKVDLSGVRQALAYLLEFLEVCLEVGRLPHFFHANAWIHYMFPDYEVDDKLVRYDLFLGKSRDALNQAKLSFRLDMRNDLSQFYDEKSDIYIDFKDTFRDYLQNGEYYA